MDILGYGRVFQVIRIITLDIHNTRHRIRIRIKGIDSAQVCMDGIIDFKCDGFCLNVGDAEF
jgi:hypothetical protein